MEFQSFNTISPVVKEQIDQVTDLWLKVMSESVIGIYVHGSLALNCFVEGVSDLDILIICDRRITRDERLLLASHIIQIDGLPSHLEMSAIWRRDLNPWSYPTPCQFHYSDSWTEHYKQMLSGDIMDSFITDEDFCDPDIASYVHLINQCGICVYGRAVQEVFPSVPESDFWSSISNDIDEYEFEAHDPRYFASNILILGRILSYKKERRILSKYEGGLWTLNYVPQRFRYLIENAIKQWYLKEKGLEYKQEDLIELKQLLIHDIKSY